MRRIKRVEAEFQRRKEALKAGGYGVEEHEVEDLLIVEMFVKDEPTGEVLIRKEEGFALQGRTPFSVASHKLIALQLLTNVVPRMRMTRQARLERERQRKR